MRIALLALVALLAFPAVARAGDVTMVARDVPLGARSLQSVQAPVRFNMVAVHWQGSGTVLYRAHLLGGGWTPWAAADSDSGPDTSSAERARTRGWADGALDWTGAADRIQFRTHGTVGRLRAYYVWSRVVRTPLRTVAMTGAPQIVSRLGWQANERIVRAKPAYAPAVRYAIVHHTVNTNTYTPAQAAAIVRGIETYHVLGNGWNDIGYNFLIDRYGTVYEGRAGGIDRNVVGAHAQGFNTGSVGIALIGTYTSVGPTAAQRAALVKLLAWRLDVAHVDPLSFVPTISGGNPRFPAGSPVTLRAISGHRDTYYTECPGNALYAQLPAIAAAVARTGLPKLYAPVAQVVEPGFVRFTVQLSSLVRWTVTVKDALGNVVGTGTGTGAKIDWSWSEPSAGPFGWTITAAGARPASGAIGQLTGAPPAPLLSALAAPAVAAPAPDGSGGAVHATFTLGRPALVTAQLLDASGTALPVLLGQQLDAGPQAFDWDASAVPDGRYRLVVTAKPSAGKAATSSLDLVVDRTLTGYATVSPAISPNGDGVLDSESFSFTLAASVPLRLEIQQGGVVLATVFSDRIGPGPQVLAWNGQDANGVPLPDGAYQAVATFTDALGDVSVSLPLTVDTTPPVLTLVNPQTLRFMLSEPATVTLLVNGQTVVKVELAGGFNVPPPKAGVQTVSAVAQDAAGNSSQPVQSP